MKQSLTLLIPTYNRPRSLARLLAFVRDRAPSIPCVVLDSGSPESQAEVRRLCEGITGVALQQFDVTTQFYDKLNAGLQNHVTTPCVCLCADDDLVDPSHLLEAANLLQSDPELSVVHGLYAHFQLGRHLTVTDLGYHGAGIDDDDPIRRVSRLLSDYEATLYGVQRTRTLSRIIEQAVDAPSLLSAELLVAVLAVASGKTSRLQVFSHARNMAPSHFSDSWHPTELLALNPKALFEGLVYVRQRLVSWLAVEGHAPAEESLIPSDLAMTVYLSDYLTPEGARAALDRALAGKSSGEMREAAWHDAAVRSQKTSFLAVLRGSSAVRWLKSQLGPDVSLLGWARWAVPGSRGGPREIEVKNRETGKPEPVKLDQPFLDKIRKVSLTAGDANVRDLAQSLSDYACAPGLDELKSS